MRAYSTSKSVCLERRHVSQLAVYSRLFVIGLDKQLLTLQTLQEQDRHVEALATLHKLHDDGSDATKEYVELEFRESEMSSLWIEPTIKSHGPQFSVSLPGDVVYCLAAVFKRLVLFPVLMSSTTMVLVFMRFSESRLNSPL
jgi:hypothetical protein